MTSDEEKRLLVLAAVAKLGGSGTKKDVLDAIAEGDLMQFSEHDLLKRTSRDELTWRNSLAYTRLGLARDGYLTSRWNNWAITEAGRRRLSELASAAAAQRSFQHIKRAALPLLVSIAEGQLTSDEAALTGETIGSEGAETQRWGTSYERDKTLRSAAIRIHGAKCMACGFDFAAQYGAIGSGFIEVHHTRPVSALGGSSRVDPATDLVVLCSNCHSIVHRRKGEPLSLQDLRETIKANRDLYLRQRARADAQPTAAPEGQLRGARRRPSVARG
ncbi:HNH endonuclease [Sorangium sp. So ce131]|uniref:HNH endonuclease n=1 Tax=Sorangium sp. So ce131 TaxID=3133282 RepID=UPI003F608C3D